MLVCSGTQGRGLLQGMEKKKVKLKLDANTWIALLVIANIQNILLYQIRFP